MNYFLESIANTSKEFLLSPFLRILLGTDITFKPYFSIFYGYRE